MKRNTYFRENKTLKYTWKFLCQQTITYYSPHEPLMQLQTAPTPLPFYSWIIFLSSPPSHRLGVQIEYGVVQIIELKRFGGAPNGPLCSLNTDEGVGSLFLSLLQLRLLWCYNSALEEDLHKLPPHDHAGWFKYGQPIYTFFFPSIKLGPPFVFHIRAS
jgi:hypothetical protein